MPTAAEGAALDRLTGHNLDSLLTEIKRQVDAQFAAISAVNARASAGLASASFVSALTGLQAAVQVSTPRATSIPAWLTMFSAIAILLSLLAYAFVVWRGLQGFWIHDFRTGPDPSRLTIRYGRDDPANWGHAKYLADENKRHVASELIDAYWCNDPKIYKKARHSQDVLIGLAVEAGLFIIVTVLQLLLPPPAKGSP